MQKILILSGKGGTGKTTTAAAFIHFANAKAFADCDVDAPNLHILGHTNGTVSHLDYYGSKKAHINASKCINCGKCRETCRFDAIKILDSHHQIDEYGCEGCGVCEYICPANAITLEDDIAGQLTRYERNFLFSTAKLKMGRGNSGKLVSAVKTQLTKYAPSNTALAIIDGSPGIGCPVIASISGVDLVLVVAEPSLSGISDMERILKTASIFQTPTAVCINKYDTNLENSKTIQDFCTNNRIPFVGLIPYDKQASIAINNGKTLAEIDCPAKNALWNVYQQTVTLLN